MIGQSLSNTNETCYSVQIAKICNLPEYPVRLSSRSLFYSRVHRLWPWLLVAHGDLHACTHKCARLRAIYHACMLPQWYIFFEREHSDTFICVTARRATRHQSYHIPDATDHLASAFHILLCWTRIRGHVRLHPYASKTTSMHVVHCCTLHCRN